MEAPSALIHCIKYGRSPHIKTLAKQKKNNLSFELPSTFSTMAFWCNHKIPRAQKCFGKYAYSFTCRSFRDCGNGSFSLPTECCICLGPKCGWCNPARRSCIAPLRFPNPGFPVGMQLRGQPQTCIQVRVLPASNDLADGNDRRNNLLGGACSTSMQSSTDASSNRARSGHQRNRRSRFPMGVLQTSSQFGPLRCNSPQRNSGFATFEM